MTRQPTAAEFREWAHRVVEWVAGYYERVEGLPVRSRVSPGEVAARLPGRAPEKGWGDAGGEGGAAGGGDGFERFMRDLEEVVVPGLTHWQSPRFFGYFPSNASYPAIVGEMLSAGLNVNGMLWSTSPAATEVETRVVDWLGELIGLPGRFLSPSGTGGGCIQGTASESALVALAAARRRAGWGRGVELSRLTVYASEQAHSSIVKAAMIAGLAAGPEDRRQVRLIGTDAELAMDVGALEAALREDVSAGRVPCFVVATVGTTGTTAVDAVDRIAGAIGRVCGGEGAGARPWLHVDAAHAGAACVCEEHRWMLRGVEMADSICFNPHKWLLTNFDCDCFWTAERASLTGALSITPEYLRNAATDAGSVIDYRDWQVALGRRFRALKLWLVLRCYGAEGLRAHVREHVRLAGLFEAWVRADGRFEVVSPRTMNLVCFRLRGGDGANRRLMEGLNGSGSMYLSHTVVPDGAGGTKVALRMAIGATLTEERHVRAAWEAIAREAQVQGASAAS
ncbi:MAG: aspartate aminotransferase family protein [Phycisphaerae bacterium]|nr:aspartate aminotransferase family protein [Phycisphaerae bacterium]